MASYRFEAQIIGRGTGRSATAAAAYRAAARIADARTGDVHDYTRRRGVEHAEILLPRDAPEWMADRAALWNAVEAVEKRKDAQLVRELLLNLPHELDHAQRRELVREYLRGELVSRGMVADFSIHLPGRDGDNRNHHAHVMLTMRALTGDGFGPKAREWNQTDQLEGWRESWAAYQNRALERAGHSARVDHRSLEARGIDREPEHHLGPAASAMERRGEPSDIGDDNRAIRARNDERADLRGQVELIDLAIERERRKGPQRRPEEPPQGRPKDEAHEARRQDERIDSARANTRRASLQSRHHDQQINLERHHDRQRAENEAKLDQAYGAHRRATERQARILAERIEGSRGFHAFLRKITGSDARDRSELDDARATLGSIAQRLAEQRGKLASQQADEARRLAQRHETERQQLENHLAHGRAPDERQQGREASNDRGRTRERYRDRGPGRG